jgi:hypothetical protein
MGLVKPSLADAAPLPRCPAAPLPRCPAAPLPRCPAAPLPRCPAALVDYASAITSASVRV